MVALKSPTFARDLRTAGAEAIRKSQTLLQIIQPRVTQMQAALATFERDRLDPWLARAFALWGDERSEQRKTLSKTFVKPVTTVEEQAFNHGIYVSAGALGLALAGNLFFPPLRLVSLVGLLYSAAPIYQQAYRALAEERTVNMNVLSALVTTAYVGNGLLAWASFTSLSYFFSLRWLSTVQDRVSEELTTVFTLHPQPIWLLVNSQEVKGWLETVQVGDMVIVRAGEVIPVDGTVVDGLASVDQQVLTGEARPVEKGPGAAVFAATLVLTGKVVILVEQTGAATTAAQIGQMLKDTIDFRTQRQQHATQLTDRLVLPILALSTATLPFLGLLSAAAVLDAHPHRHLNNLSTLSMLNFLLLATRQGILIKDGRSLELLNEVDTLIFDKTGTLTQKEPVVAAIHSCWPEQLGQGAEQVLMYAAAAEQYQSHPIAYAILAAAQARQLPMPPIDEATYKVGYGLVVTINEQKVQVGSERFMALEGITLPPAIEQVQASCQREGHSLVLVAVAGCLIGALELQTILRPEAKELLAALRQRPQIRSMIIVSGDQPAPTARLAQELGITDYFADVLPAGKAELIAHLQANGRKVCFIGDGINDAVALKQANVSISLRGATTAAIDTAQIVLMDESLHQLRALFELVQEFDANQRNTIFAVLTPGVVGLVGIYAFGFGLVQMRILDMIDLSVGTSIAMRPWWRQRQLAKGADGEKLF